MTGSGFGRRFGYRFSLVTWVAALTCIAALAGCGGGNAGAVGSAGTISAAAAKTTGQPTPSEIRTHPAPAFSGGPPVASPQAWGTAHQVPGMAALDLGKDSGVSSVSCSSAGNCSAGGNYADSSGLDQAFVVSEVNGTWRQAEEVPGTATLNTGALAVATDPATRDGAGTSSVSCGSSGNCAAAGYYTDSSGHVQAFLVSEVNGTWQQAKQVAGLPDNGYDEIKSVSCASAGNCSAGGLYRDNFPHANENQAFVVSEVNGTWQQAEEVPGAAALNHVPRLLGGTEINSVSCASAGNCSAGGDYTDSSSLQQAFVVSEVNGTWQQAEEVPGTATLNNLPPNSNLGGAQVNSVSCASAGNCSAGGDYTDSSSLQQAFVVSEVNGTWQQAEEVPGTATLNLGGNGAEIDSLSCASAGNCSAGGRYGVSLFDSEAFVVSEVSGTWQQAEKVPGTATLNQGENAGIGSVSCASAGNCSADGSYWDATGDDRAFVVSEVSGTWQQADAAPGTATLKKGGTAGIGSVSCVSAGNCSAGGSIGSAAFLVSSSPTRLRVLRRHLRTTGLRCAGSWPVGGPRQASVNGPASQGTWRTLASPWATSREGSSAASSAAERSPSSPFRPVPSSSGPAGTAPLPKDAGVPPEGAGRTGSRSAVTVIADNDGLVEWCWPVPGGQVRA